MSKQFEAAFAAYQKRQNRPRITRQPWYIKMLVDVSIFFGCMHQPTPASGEL